MTTIEKIYKSINNTEHNSIPYNEGVYEYKGLVEDVENALIEEGYDLDGDIPTNIIDDLVYELI